MKSQIVNADDIIGIKVRNTKDTELGTVEAVMLDTIQGQVAYIIVSFDGFLGRDHKLFALPWHMFSYDTIHKCFSISVDKERLTNSPGFDKNQWPDMSNNNWSTSIHRYYGTLPNRARH